ncbi:MAG: PEGA domain-containing protein [Candidatus Omnitrophica bacterium]|nr:PEGA domain-containing protein [Candidatus Omnitrophota bacterium]
MATDPTDLMYPTSADEILQIDNKIDALARQWLTRIQTNFWQFDAAVRTRVTWFNEQHYNPLRVYEGILDHYEAILADLNQYKTFLDDNNFPMSSSYYKYYTAYVRYYEAYADVATAPNITQEDLDNGKIIGICDRIDDGDTLFVNDREIRLAGIDTKEKGTYRGGVTAAQRLRELVVGKVITVYFDPHTPLEMYRRVLGAVYLGDGTNEELYLRPDWQDIFVNYIMVNECLAEPNDKGRNQYIDPELIKGAYQKCKVADSPDLVRLTIKTKATHARIFVDGVDVRKVTPASIDVRPGRHHITLAADGCSAWHEDIDIGFGDNVIFRTLIPLPVASGLISIFTVPEDCEVLVDDMPQGVAPIIGMQRLASQPVVITVTKEGYESRTVSIVPLAGRNIDVTFDPLQKV